MPDSLGDRMKGYENAYRISLPRRMPIIVRIDGRAFHTFTKGFQKPYDSVLSQAMWETAQELCRQISGAKLAYVQSDEISVLITNDDTLDTQPWFNNILQKIVSLSSSIATISFNMAFRKSFQLWAKDEMELSDLKLFDTYCGRMNQATFDARAFVIPNEEVCNYFIWRQQDAIRNSIQMAVQAVYSHKELMYKNQSDMQDMLMKKGINWNHYQAWQKRGICITKQIDPETNRSSWQPDKNTPIFTQNRLYINHLLPSYHHQSAHCISLEELYHAPDHYVVWMSYPICDEDGSFVSYATVFRGFDKQYDSIEGKIDVICFEANDFEVLSEYGKSYVLWDDKPTDDQIKAYWEKST